MPNSIYKQHRQPTENAKASRFDHIYTMETQENAVDNDIKVLYKTHTMSRAYLLGLRERLKKELAELDQLLSAFPKRQQPKAGGGYGTVGRDVVAAIGMCGSTFTIREVRQNLAAIGTTLTTVQIATVLARLTKQEKIAIIKPKRGNVGAVYQKPAV